MDKKNYFYGARISFVTAHEAVVNISVWRPISFIPITHMGIWDSWVLWSIHLRRPHPSYELSQQVSYLSNYLFLFWQHKQLCDTIICFIYLGVISYQTPSNGNHLFQITPSIKSWCFFTWEIGSGLEVFLLSGIQNFVYLRIWCIIDARIASSNFPLFTRSI